MYASLVVRRVGTSDYRVRVRVMSTSTTLTLYRMVNNTLTSLGVVTLPGLVYNPGDTLRLQLRAVGSGTTTLQAQGVASRHHRAGRRGRSPPTTPRPACRRRVGSGSTSYLSGAAGLAPRRRPLGCPRGHRAVGGSLTSVVVGILTYLRPDGLRSTVAAVLEQAAEVGNATVLVVDNDPEAERDGVGRRVPGRSGADRARADAGHRRGSEPGPRRERGCRCPRVHRRRRAARGRLAPAMLDTWEQTQAAAVAGPVLSTFAGEPDPCVTEGRFFVRRRLPTGTDLTVAATGQPAPRPGPGASSRRALRPALRA